MNLRDYLHFNNMTAQKMADDLGVDGNYLRCIRLKKNKPGRDLCRRIEIYTGGQVTEDELRGVEK